jgi:hypothetical protein
MCSSLCHQLLNQCLRLDGLPIRAYLALRPARIGKGERPPTDEEHRPDAASRGKAS